jgi:hypothetical protein
MLIQYEPPVASVKQQSFSNAEYVGKKKRTRREVFLAQWIA